MWHSWQGMSPHTHGQGPRVTLCDMRGKAEVLGPSHCLCPTYQAQGASLAHSNPSPSRGPGEVGDMPRVPHTTGGVPAAS